MAVSAVSAVEQHRRRDARRTIADWFWGLFVLPADERKPWPFGVDKYFKRWFFQWRSSFDIPRNAKWYLILWRLFVLPPLNRRDRDSRAIWLRRVRHLRRRWRFQTDQWVKGTQRQLLDIAAAFLTRIHGFRLMRWFTASACLAFAWSFVTAPLQWQQQFALCFATLGLALLVRKNEGRGPALLLICLSVLSSVRYFYWRATSTLDLASPVEYLLGYGLFAAELYALVILLLSYMQSIWPLKRQPAPLPDNPADWPSVDVFIPTYNEPLSVVSATVFAAQGLDWPKDKLNIYILDDGCRAEFAQFAEQTGVRYLERKESTHAKAGNLNLALTKTDGDFIAIFDCDHMPVRSFLQTTMGWFFADPKCALVQTPHHFFSPDPMERNLKTFRRVPNEGKLFYGLVQDGNDLWNATFFCGSCAVLRRGPLEEVGGIAVETVTEDAHTALKLHRRGYTSAYMNVIQAAGLATDSLGEHIGQRIRWARGMAQIFTVDNPLRGKGLKLPQRLCYLNSMMHFLHGLPRLAFLTAPLAYLFFGLHVFNAEAILIAAYVLPHLLQSSLANAQLQGKYRHSFWAEVYESVLAWYIALPTTLALINPKLGQFNVTAKGGVVEKAYFDWRVSRPFIGLILLGVLGLCFGVVRFLDWNAHEPLTVLMNMTWTVYNLIVLGAAVGIAEESKQTRRAHRVPLQLPGILYSSDGHALRIKTQDISMTGLSLDYAKRRFFEVGEQVKLLFPQGGRECVFDATVVHSRVRNISLRFENMDLATEKLWVQCTFGRANLWLEWDEASERDRPLSSLAEVFAFGLLGYRRIFRRLLLAEKDRRTEKQVTEAATA